jgi:ABC-2 type transport system ATP-binding protein
MSAAMIEVEKLCKQFPGITALTDVSFEIEQGKVVGFIGANGAGKTTTMRILATIELPTSGSVRIDGHDVTWEPSYVRARLGWMPDHFQSYKHVSVLEYLDFFARAYGFRGAERRARVREVLEFTDLSRLAEQDSDTLSTGQKQRLSLARTLIHDPAVLILDEPAAGLDPRARSEFKRLVRVLADEGRTMLISSHILSELDEMCDELLFIHDGRILHQGSMDGLISDQTGTQMVRVEILEQPSLLEEWAAHTPGVELVKLERRGALLVLDPGEDEAVATALRRLIGKGLSVVSFAKVEPTLEHTFVSMLDRITEPKV